MKYLFIFIIVAALQQALFSSCKKNQDTSELLQITFENQVTQIAEDVPNGTSDINIFLSEVPGKEVSFDYTTADSTAISGKDYTAISDGKLIFKPGERSKAIKINVLSDTAQKKDVCFKLILSNPVNCVLVKPAIVIKVINTDFATLVWSDEFNSGQLNTAIWNYELGATGWGNNELENYTNSINNVHIDTGYLHISALNPSGSSYTSGRITTKGKKEFTYFKVDIRAKLPEGKGVWPAIWALGANISTVSWPKCGEIDIMELLGHAPSTTYGTIHWDANGHQQNGNSFTLTGGKFSSGFHTFSLIWTPNQFKWLIDKKEFLYISRGSAPGFPFDLPQFFIFNVAVGGNWPGSPDLTTKFPQHMIIDYIRVYQ